MTSGQTLTNDSAACFVAGVMTDISLALTETWKLAGGTLTRFFEVVACALASPPSDASIASEIFTRGLWGRELFPLASAVASIGVADRAPPLVLSVQ